MYDNTEVKIIEQVYLKPGIHKRELSKQIKLKMPSIDYAIKKLGKSLKIDKSGNQINYSLDYSKNMIVPILYEVEYLRFERLPVNVRFAVKDFLSELKEKPVIALIFGSYAKGNYNSNSDIDILFVFQKLQSEKSIEDTAKKIGMKTNTIINPVYLDYNSFRENFHNSTKEFFKNIRKDKIILVGIELWRQLQNEEA
jgi:predicted nucleotidyltransferase